MVLKAYRYRIRPSAAQRELFNKHFDCCRWIYNQAIAACEEAYKNGGKAFDTLNKLGYEIKDLRKGKPWLKEINCQSLHSELEHVKNAYKHYFRKMKAKGAEGAKFGRPRFKNKFDSRKSFTAPQWTTVDWDNSCVSIIKIPNIKARLHRRFVGKIKMATIIKEPSGKYYISICVETPGELPAKPPVAADTAVGVDLGLKCYAALSDGQKIPNPKYYLKEQTRLTYLQRQLSKKKKGGANRRKAKIAVAKQHEKVVAKRRDFLHNLSRWMIRIYNTVCIEDLNVKGMTQNRRLAKHITDAAWGEFRRQLGYKSDWYGTNLLTIGRFIPSSKKCSQCGWIYGDLKLSERRWICKNCGADHDRDYNAAVNIMTEALNESLKGPCGASVEMPSIEGSMKQEVAFGMFGGGEQPNTLLAAVRATQTERLVLQ